MKNVVLTITAQFENEITMDNEEAVNFLREYVRQIKKHTMAVNVESSVTLDAKLFYSRHRHSN